MRASESTLLQDSTEIIETLNARHAGRDDVPSVHPVGPVQRLLSLMLETYGDERLVFPAMHCRWHHNRDWAIGQLGALNAPQATPEVQLHIGARCAAPFAEAAELLGATPAMQAAVEASYEQLLQKQDTHLAPHPALLGGVATLGDFGFIGPLYTHLWRDPASGEPLPRTLGQRQFTLEGCTGERIVRPYSLWMLQRVRDHLAGLSRADRLRAEALLREVGAEQLIHSPDPPCSRTASPARAASTV